MRLSPRGVAGGVMRDRLAIALGVSLGRFLAPRLWVTRRGGLTFVRIGRARFSFCMVRP